MNTRRNSLVLFSGGYDSTSLLWDMCKNPTKYLGTKQKNLVIYPVYCHYGNVNTGKEIDSAKSVISYIKSRMFSNGSEGVLLSDLRIVQMPHLNGTITVRGGDCSHDGFFAREYVPFRNATMVLNALASCTTPELDFDGVYMGCHASDAELHFPDCGRLFEERMTDLFSVYSNKMVGGSSFPSMLLPFQAMTKKQISENYPLPEDLTKFVFSGYTDGKPPKFEEPDFEDDGIVVAPTPIAEQCKEQAPKFYQQTIPVAPDKPFTHTDVAEAPEEREQPATSLMVKEHEPLVIRKFTQYGFPIYVGLICGANLDNLDSVVHGFLKGQKERIQGASIQTMRNIVGELSGHITETYGLKIEGVAVVWYVDKMMVSSLYGDFMTHTSCRIEFFSLLQMMCHV